MKEKSASRRNLIATTGIASLSGCLGSLPSVFSTADGISLGTIFVDDYVDDNGSYQIKLERDNEVVYHEEVELSSGGAMIHPTWSTAPAEYTLIFATDDILQAVSIPDDVEHRIDDEDADCYHAQIKRTSRVVGVDIHAHDSRFNGVCTKSDDSVSNLTLNSEVVLPTTG